MSTPHPTFTRLDRSNSIVRRKKSKRRSPGISIRRRSPGRKLRKTRRKISPKRSRPKSPLSNEISIKEFDVDTLPKERKTPKEQKTLKDLAIEIANSKEKQPGCFGKLCKKVTSKFTRRRGGKRKRRKTRKRRKGHRGSPPRRR